MQVTIFLCWRNISVGSLWWPTTTMVNGIAKLDTLLRCTPFPRINTITSIRISPSTIGFNKEHRRVKSSWACQCTVNRSCCQVPAIMAWMHHRMEAAKPENTHVQTVSWHSMRSVWKQTLRAGKLRATRKAESDHTLRKAINGYRMTMWPMCGAKHNSWSSWT